MAIKRHDDKMQSFNIMIEHKKQHNFMTVTIPYIEQHNYTVTIQCTDIM